MLQLLSSESVESEWVKKEVDKAMNQEIEGRRAKVLPLLYKSCDLPGFFIGKLKADFTSENNYKLSLSRILQTIGLITESGINRIYEIEENGIPVDYLTS
jgi:hypothetical protein